MPVDDLWFSAKRDPHTGQRKKTARHGRGRRYRVRWNDDAGKQQTRSFDRKGDADRFDANVRADVTRGEYIDHRAGRVTYRHYAERWQANQVHRESTRAQVETHFRRHVLPYFGDRAIGAIRPTDVQGFVRHLSEGLAPATVEVIYRYTAAVFRAAVADRVITSSPCQGVKLPKIEPKRVEPLPVEAVRVLTEAMDPALRALVDVGAAAGLRQGEALGLEVPHVDFLRRTLRVEQQLMVLPGAPPFLAPPKTDASRRTIPIGKVLCERLAAHLASHPAAETEVVDKTGSRPTTRMARLIFTTSGQPIRRTGYSARIWRPAIARATARLEDSASTRAARVAAAELAEKLRTATFHDLRHFFASLLIAHGASVREVQERLGHASATETLGVYAHLWPDSDDRTREAVDLVLGELAGRPTAVA